MGIGALLGNVARERERSLLVVHGSDAAGVGARIDALRRLHPRHAVVDVGRGALLPLAPAARRLLKRTRARLVLTGGVLDAAQRLLVAEARRRGCAVAPIETDDTAVSALFAPSRRGSKVLPEGRPWLHRRFDRRLDDVDAIAAALGRPRTVLCLGNGPSCEDPGLDGIAHDSLFRVNWQWLARGRHLQPDLVFTSLLATLTAVRPRVATVLKTRADEAAALRRRVWPFPYAVAERLGLYAPDAFGASSPTNGAVMLALAVALAPQRLVVAGIDLFSHPAGAYPGDTMTANAYTLGHDASRERDFVRAVLGRYRGELVVFGPALAALAGR